jgi:hypothetical protein
MKWVVYGLASASIVLAASTGYLAATALGQAGEPTRTVTVDVTGLPGHQAHEGRKAYKGHQGRQENLDVSLDTRPVFSK